jgi:hypothetical protein
MKFAKARGFADKNAGNYGVYEDERNPKGGRDLKRVEATLPAGTIIECDRVYIRTHGKSGVHAEDDYDSITWKVIKPNGKTERHGRFWVKLSNCNGLEFDLAVDSLYRDRVKLVRLVMES